MNAMCMGVEDTVQYVVVIKLVLRLADEVSTARLDSTKC